MEIKDVDISLTKNTTEWWLKTEKGTNITGFLVLKVCHRNEDSLFPKTILQGT